MSTVKVTALKNGPYKVEGAIALFYDTAPVDTRGEGRRVPVPMRSLEQEAVLRRNALEDRIPGGREHRSGKQGIASPHRS